MWKIFSMGCLISIARPLLYNRYIQSSTWIQSEPFFSVPRSSINTASLQDFPSLNICYLTDSDVQMLILFARTFVAWVLVFNRRISVKFLRTPLESFKVMYHYVIHRSGSLHSHTILLVHFFHLLSNSIRWFFYMSYYFYIVGFTIVLCSIYYCSILSDEFKSVLSLSYLFVNCC